MNDRPQVLFVCVRNAGRSQMAAALLTLAAGDRIDVRSAGSMPAEDAHPVVIEAMAELGVDLSASRPRALDTDEVRSSDVVVTMGCGDACPVFPGIRYLDWAVEDPADRPISEVRGIRDEIAGRVHALVAELLGTAPL